jgi:hypothetical protein
VSVALDDAFNGRRALADALAAYQAARDEATMPMFELTTQLASFEPPTEEETQLFAAIAGDERASDDFARTLAGTLPVTAFFDPDNLARYSVAEPGSSSPTAGPISVA